MSTLTITGDTTQEALEEVLYQGIAKYGQDFNVKISKNLRFENQNKEIKLLKRKHQNAVCRVIEKYKDSLYASQIKEILQEVLIE